MAAAHPKHRAVIAWARKQLGKSEEPPGSNTGTFVRFCQQATWLPGTRWPWCRAFNLRAHLEAGFTLPDRSAGAWDALARARQRGDALNPAGYRHLIPGDEVIWAFGSGHSSIFTGWRLAGGRVYIDSIDGNVGDKVAECSRPLSLVKGFIVWHETAATVKPARAPVGQVVGGVSGKRKLIVGPLRLPLPHRKPGVHGVIAKTAPASPAGESGPTTVTARTAARPKPKATSSVKKPAAKKNPAVKKSSSGRAGGAGRRTKA